MRRLTLEYLSGVCDAIYFAQSELLGGEIEEEKDFTIGAYLSGDSFEVRMTSCIALKDTPYENEPHRPVNSTRVIYIEHSTKPGKVVRDILAEMEHIYNMPIPEVV